MTTNFDIKRFVTLTLFLLTLFFIQTEKSYAQQVVSINPLNLDFGNVDLGNNPVDTMYVQNNTSGPVLVYLYILGGDSSYFQFVSGGNYFSDSIAAFGELNVPIRFSPVQARQYTSYFYAQVPYYEYSTSTQLYGTGVLPPFLTVIPSDTLVSYNSGSITLTINSNINWSVSDNVSWLNENPASGSDTGTVTVTINQNLSTSQRSGTITVSGGGITIKLVIIQIASPPFLTVSPSDTSVSYNSTSITFAVNSNISWIVSDTSSWLTENPVNGAGNGIITVNVAQNLSINQRVGTITISGGDITRIITITQLASPPFLTVSPSDTSVSNNSGSITVTVNSNISWSVSDTSSWLTENHVNGTGNGTITVNVAQNLSINQRVGTITISGGDITRTITITQLASPPFLTVSPSDTSVSNNSGSITLVVKSNISWSVSDTSSWLTENPVNGTGNGIVTVNVAQNLSINQRSGTITVSGGDITRTITITQLASPPFLTVSPSDTSVSNNSGSIILTVNSNISWSVSDTSSWLTENPVNGTGNGTVTVNVDQNLSINQRSGTITVSGGDITRTITITQLASAPFLIVNPSDTIIGNNSGSIKLTIASNISWSVSDTSSWLTENPINGTGNGTVQVTIEQNLTTNQRLGKVTVTGGDITRTMIITQLASAPFLTVSPSDTSVSNNSGSIILTINSNISWSVSDTSSWLIENPINGTGNGKVTVNVEQNLSINQRSGTITVSGGDITRTITITQLASAPFLTVSPSDTSVSNNSGNIILTVNSNISWNVSDTSSWLSENPANGKGNGTITVKVDQNLAASQRIGEIIVTGGEIKRTINITQLASAPFLTVNPSDTSVSNNSGSITLTITSNISWNVSDTSLWLAENPINGTGNGSVKVTIDQNLTSSQRTGIITVTGGSITRAITITQSAAPYLLTVNPLNKLVPDTSGSTSFSITSNTNWRTSDDATWLTVSPDSGTNNGILTAIYTRNQETIQRSGKITVSGGDITRIITITQSAAPYILTVTPSNRDVSYSSDSTSFSITSNTNWKVSDDAEWLTVIPDSGTGNRVLTAIYTKNQSSLQRIGKITVAGGNFKKVITVTQSLMPSISVTLPNSTNSGENINIGINPPQNFNSIAEEFFYRKGGQVSYHQLAITSETGLFNALIPADSITERGIQYYIKFSDAKDSITFPAIDPVNHPASLQINIQKINYGIDLKPSAYSMISVPLNISNPALSSVLEDDYNTYDIHSWRILRWDPSSNTYVEFPNIKSSFQPGNGFWLITKEGKKFNIDNALSVETDSAYTITLQPGYNQIGDPYAFPVAWSDIINSNLVGNPVNYDPDTKDYGKLDVSVLNPWEAYFVHNDSSHQITLRVPPIETPEKIKKNIANSIGENGFVIQIKSKIEMTDIQDYQNYVGMSSNAKDGYDKLDILTPPPITNDLNLNIISGGKEYAQNIVSLSTQGASWDLKINTRSGDKNVKLTFEKKIPPPDNFKIWLLDKERRLSIPIINGRASVSSSGEKEKFLRLIIGTEEFAKTASDGISLTPSEYILFQNFPNPFNPVTNIYYSLKKNSVVTLEIFDILGRKIKSLFTNENQDAGLHNVKWNGTNNLGIKVASGIYIYQIRTSNFISSKKMILMK